MSQSFGTVEEKLRESEFFLGQMHDARPHGFEARCFFSAYVSAARSVTLALQATMSGTDGFNLWYQQAQGRLKVDPLARFFVEIRNGAIHKGLNPLNQVTIEHLRESLSLQLHRGINSSMIILPDLRAKERTTLADANQACLKYFRSLVEVVFDCYQRFRNIVDPRWHFTRENFLSMGKTLEDAVEELGLPRKWTSFVASESDGWKLLRSQQPPCLINDLFLRYAGKRIPDPDESDDAII